MTTSIIKTGWLTLAFSGALFAGAAPLQADPATRPTPFTPSMKVRFADLNLNTEEGARVLYGRIRAAAQKVCGTRSSVWDARRWQAWTDCYRATVDDAVGRINRPTLSAVHRIRATARPG
jgi:UrcA family protein